MDSEERDPAALTADWPPHGWGLGDARRHAFRQPLGLTPTVLGLNDRAIKATKSKWD